MPNWLVLAPLVRGGQAAMLWRSNRGNWPSTTAPRKAARAGPALAATASDFQDRQRSPHDSLHGLYRALILAHGERAKRPRKCCFTRKYSHAGSLLIMVCF
jgi:hypothetical protein